MLISPDNIIEHLKNMKQWSKSASIPKELPKSSQDNIMKRLKNVKLSSKSELLISAQDTIIKPLENQKLSSKTAFIPKEFLKSSQDNIIKRPYVFEHVAKISFLT